MRPTLRSLFAFLVASLLLWPGALAAQDASPGRRRSHHPAASPVASPVAGEATHGVLLANMDPSTDPGEDFYRYANGGWLDRTEIPADEARYGQFNVVNDLTIEQLLTLLDRLSTSEEVPVGSDEWKAVQLFRQTKDLGTRNDQGITPIEADLAAIDAISTLDEFYLFVRDGILTTNIGGLYGLYADVDLADSSVNTAWYYGPASVCPTVTTTGSTPPKTRRSARPTATPPPNSSATRATTPPAARPPPRRSTIWRSGWPNRCSAPRTTTTPATTTTRCRWPT